jgi:hypothetical protein
MRNNRRSLFGSLHVGFLINLGSTTRRNEIGLRRRASVPAQRV